MVLLPLTVLRSSQNRPVMVEVKSGDSYNGHLDSCDGFMNLHLRNVIRTSSSGSEFTKLSEIYIRGVSIKFMRFEDEVLENVKDETKQLRRQQRENRNFKRKYNERQSGSKPSGSEASSSANRGSKSKRGRGGKKN